MTQDLRGFSLLEMALAVGISGMVIAGIWQTTAGVQRQANAQQAASQLLSVAQAAQVAINNNKVAWLDTSTGPIAAVNAVACIKVTAADTCATAISDLQTLGVLPATAVAQNVYSQTYKFYIQRIDGGAPGADADDRIAGLVITTSGNDMDDDSGRMAAITIGAAGSYLPSDYAGTTTGTGGSWTLTLNAAPWSTAIGTDAAAGHLAVFLPMMPNAPTMGASVGASASKIDDLSDGVTTASGSTENLFLGKDAGLKSVDAGSTVTAATSLGYAALRDNTFMKASAFGYQSQMTAGGDSSVTYDNLTIGSGTLNCLTFNAPETTIVGNTSGGCPLGAAPADAGVTALGHQVFPSNSSTNNTGAGYQALFSADDATHNLALGYQALYSTVSDKFLTAVGHQALNSRKGTVTLFYDANTAIGSQSLKSNILSTGLTALGYQAMYSNNGGGTTFAAGYKALYADVRGGGNAALGSQALMALTGNAMSSLGISNSAAGYNAGKSVTTGSYNVAVGDSALSKVTTGNRNTAIGYMASSSLSSSSSDSSSFGSEALRYNVAGINTAFGYQAAMGDAVTLPSLMSATHNSSFGYQSMNTLINGVDNSAMGYQSLMAITTGSYNTAAGQIAAYELTTGSHNIAMGINSLRSNVTGSNNIGLGNSSETTNGSNNIAIGSSTLAMALLNQTPNNNIAIGYSNLTALNTGADRNLAIGSDVGKTIQTGADNILIGTPSSDTATGSTVSRTIAMGSEATLIKPQADENIALGDYTMAALTTGQANTAIGYGNMYSITTAVGNTALGETALNMLETGNYNTAIGGRSMTNIVNGSYNVGLGYKSGIASSSMSYNTIAGWWAVNNSTATTTIGNIAIGQQAGRNINGSNNIVVGHLAGYATGNTFSNTIALGYNAIPTASNTVKVGNAAVTTISGQVAWSAISDRRDKHDIADTDLDESFIMALRPVSYRLNNGNGRLDLGFIAQEVEKALKGRITNMVIREHDQRRSYMLRATDMLSPIVKTVQQQDSRLSTLKARSAALEEKISTMEAELSTLEAIAQKRSDILAGGTR